MSYPSQLIGRIHYLLVAILLLIYVCVFINQLGYELSYDFYYNYLSSFDQVIVTLQDDLYIVVCISFLVWLLRVHSALRRIEPDYPITEFGFIIRMLPFIQLWGIASTFNQMSIYYDRHPLATKQARAIRLMIGFIYIGYFGLMIVSYIPMDNSGGIITYTIMVGNILMFTVFILTTYWVNQALYTCVIEPQAASLTSSRTIIISELTIGELAYTQLTPEMVHPQFVQANIWRRFAAKAIEYGIFIALTIIVLLPGALNDDALLMGLSVAITWLLWIIYLSIHLSINGQTIGKWLMKVKIVRIHTGEEGGFLHNVLIRTFANYIVASFVPFYSLVDILFIFSKDARCVHDLMASTQVIKVSS